MENYKIVIVDGEKKTLVLKSCLEKEGVTVSMLHLGGGALPETFTKPLSLMMLDLLLPMEAVASVFQKLVSPAPFPVLFLVARAGDRDQLLGLELGVRDYLSRISLPKEISTKVVRKLRERRPQRTEKKLSAGPVAVDIACRSASIGGIELDLTPIEFELLKLFMSAPGVVFSREDIISDVYKTNLAGRHRTIDCHISNLRKKIAHHLPGQTVIRTVYGSGYSLKASQ